MRQRWKSLEYYTEVKSDNAEGWISLELVCDSAGERRVVGRVTFWDAEGQYSLEMFETELPLTIVEALIREARTTIGMP